MQVSLNTPALLFPAITLMMLAYTNRFLSLATLIRTLHAHYKASLEDKALLKEQINNLRRRMILIRQMQVCGIISFFLCVLSMLFIYLQLPLWGDSLFAISLVFLLASLAFSLNEIRISTRALEIELRDMEA